MESRRKIRIGVMGPAQCTEHGWDLAFRVGQGIGKYGAILVCGGRGGVMEAAARGASESGALTVGILPGSQAEDANPYIDLPIVTGMGNARNAVNVLTSQAIIAIHGGYGTLSEIGLALKCGTPVIGLETWALVRPEGIPDSGILAAHTPEEAVVLALDRARQR
jgi:uncharacterized protein (TIGR00725 family)